MFYLFYHVFKVAIHPTPHIHTPLLYGFCFVFRVNIRFPMSLGFNNRRRDSSLPNAVKTYVL